MAKFWGNSKINKTNYFKSKSNHKFPIIKTKEKSYPFQNLKKVNFAIEKQQI